jgi:type I restriction enzyme S subunit
MVGDPVENEKGWEVKKLEEVYKFIDYRGKTPTKISSGIPLITARNVRYGYLDYTIKDYISEEEYKERQSRGIAKKGDLLFSTEAPLGYAAIADLDEYSTGQRLIALQKLVDIENIYVMYYILSSSFQEQLRRQATGSTAQGIKAAKLKTMIVTIPPLPLQQSFASRIEQIEKLKSEVQNAITDLESLLASRMQYWFE